MYSLAEKEGRKAPKFPKHANASQSMEVENGNPVFHVKRGKKITKYDNLYLFEINYINPQIKALKSRIRSIRLRIQKEQRKLLHVDEVHVCFGTKKIFKKQWTSEMDHAVWLNKFRKKDIMKC